ncbi:hypothetical protein C8R45DRAFT_1070419, partial [Mycena sanguinolenta]
MSIACSRETVRLLAAPPRLPHPLPARPRLLPLLRRHAPQPRLRTPRRLLFLSSGALSRARHRHLRVVLGRSSWT